ncbi:MAG: hypothetical protein VBE63_22115 [Lamprobacter sp.]|uniref:hypothetical protein n=1 Tax=Lamprobacter sp. TaxID=3100796 RepID=UPI002B25744D|nr:hypothetical protein [Lamprobacter sp.]MEA3642613.1 hypothetical protein [Lamprobacter sp.]
MIRLNTSIKKKTHQASTTVGGTSISALGSTAFALLLSTTGALADPVTVDEYINKSQLGDVEIQFPSINDGLFIEGYDSVQISFYNNSARVYAGALGGNAQAVDNNPFDPAALYRSSDDVIFYCVDLFNDLLMNKGFKEYVVLPVDGDTQVTSNEGSETVTRNFGKVLEFLGALNSVLQTEHALTHGDQNWLNPTESWMSGAIQLGIWESLYDETMNIFDGNFKVSETGGVNKQLDPSGVTLLNLTFAQMQDENNNSLSGSKVLWFQSENGQDLLADPVQVPTPGSVVLFLGGLLLLASVSRRRSPIN